MPFRMFYARQPDKKGSAIEHKAVIEPSSEALHHESVSEVGNHNRLSGRKLVKKF